MTEFPSPPGEGASLHWSCAVTASPAAHQLATAFNALVDYVQANRVEDPQIIDSVRSLGCQLCINAGGGGEECRNICDPLTKKSIH